MFDPVLNLSADVYEVLLAASLFVTVLAVLALRRKAKQAATYRQAAVSVGLASTHALLDMTKAATEAIVEADERADEAQEEAEHWKRLAMESAADADDVRDEARNPDPVEQLLRNQFGPRVRIMRVPAGRDPMMDAIMADLVGTLFRSGRKPRPGPGTGPQAAERETPEAQEPVEMPHPDVMPERTRANFRDSFAAQSPRAG